MTGQDFWSRRRAAVASEDEVERNAQAREEIAEIHEELEENSDDEILAALDLPDPDTLGKGDDFSGFMRTLVPERIRRRALRRLWATNPALANLDGLVDYGEDFTDAATVIENLATAYQVGRGMTKHVLEMARQAAEEDSPDGEPEAGMPDAESAPEEPVHEEAPVEVSAQTKPDTPTSGEELAEFPDFEPDSQTIIYARPARMRYVFDNDTGKE